METVLAILSGLLFATGFYSLLRRSIVKLAIGLVLLTHAANLLVLTVAGLRLGSPPLIEADESELLTPYADPLPQALILTAIVIGLGVLAYAIVLVHRVHARLATDDTDRLEV